MKQDRKLLEPNLHSVFIDINSDKNKIDKIIDIMKNHNFTPGETKKIINQSVQVEYLSKIDLCLITIATYEVTAEPIVNPENFFNEPELAEAKLYKRTKDEFSGRMVFYDVVEIVKDKQWICAKRAYKEISKDIQEHMLTYNFETQREPLKVAIGNTIVRIPNIKPKKVSEIKDIMKTGKFLANLLTYNIRYTENPKYYYDEKNKSLIVEQDDETFCDIIDGANRIFAINDLITEEPDAEGHMIISILHVESEEAQNYVYREQKAAPIATEQLNMLNNENDYMRLTKDISKTGNEMTNELFGKMAKDFDEVKLENKLVTFNTMAMALEKSFNYSNSWERKKAKDFIVEFFNYLIGYLRNKYGEDVKQIKENYTALNNNMFPGYLIVAGKLYGKSNWESKLESFLNTIDFSKENPVWEEIAVSVDMSKFNDVNKSMINSVVKYFKKIA